MGGSKIAVLAREIGSGRKAYSEKLKTPAAKGTGAILRVLDEQIDSVPGKRKSMRGLGVSIPGHVEKKVRDATGRKLSAAEALARAGAKADLERATRSAVQYLGTSVVAICSLLDPEAIVFGGGTSTAGEALLRRVREQVAPHLAVRPRLVLAKLGSDSQLYGAMWGAAEVIGFRAARRSRETGRLNRDPLRRGPSARAR